MNKEWKHVQTLLISHNCDVSLVRVISVDNSADKLSRGLDSSKAPVDVIKIDIPFDLHHLLIQVLPLIS